MDKYIRVKNCNCISDATIEIVEKSLNIKYGSNGTGKSTISEAIYAQANNETDRLKDLKPYGSDDNSQPTVDNPYFHVVKVFNEDYVNSYLFQGDEFLDDSFQVFLKSDKCDSLAAQIERMLEELQDLINNIDAIHNLRTFLPQYTAAVKASDGTVSRRGGVAEFVKGYCFIVDAGMQYLFVNGKVDENINSCFQKTRTMQAKLDVLKPISGIREVFAHFIVECVYKKDNYNICFDYLSGKVKAEIKEQDLRNILLQYLEKNMRGEVSVEFCTDYLNDEESVDIYIYDGCQRAIIEVKFSLPEKYYAGSTHYSITARTGDGIKQLDKYARHLAKDGRLVDFGYVYMFYMSDVKKETLMSRIDNKTNELLRGLSDELNSIFDGVEMNDMKCWGTAS